MKYNRREFLKVGVMGTTSALITSNALAAAMQQYASEAASPFPAPVYRTLGRTGMRVTTVGFGAMLTPEPEVIRVAFEHGINYVNTSRKYMGGKNEEIVGKALKGFRHKVFVATKIQTELNTREAIIKDVEASLKALGTDYIDVIQLDANADKDRIFKPEPREAFTRLKEQGKVRFFGAAVHKNPADVVNALANDPTRFFDTVLVAYNFKSGKELTDAVAKAAKIGIGIIAMKTQAGGYATDALGGISPNQAALKWILQDPHVATAVPGMRDLSELREDAAVMGMSFASADQRILQRYGEAIQPRYCSMCGGCDGTCPQGVDISTISRSLMYAEGSYRSREMALDTYRELSPAASATACLDCGECVARCANGLNIPARMAQMTRILRG